MENKKNRPLWKGMSIKIVIIAVLALVMQIPLSMVRSSVDDRSSNHWHAIAGITGSWGSSQTFNGPYLSYRTGKETSGKDGAMEKEEHRIYPDSLICRVGTKTEVLHRSIYDVPVYTAQVDIRGNLVLDRKLPAVGEAVIHLGMNDLKGIQGTPVFVLGGKQLVVKAGTEGLMAEVLLGEDAREGDVLPFEVSLKVNGSESLYFRPVAGLTEVELTSDYPDPSFEGDFLPSERDVRPDGFSAKWIVSQISIAEPSLSRFGVRLIQPVTQYHQTQRAIKYGLLVVFLVFIAAFVVEMISRKPINIIQYMVVGASLVLFYSLLLALCDFISFGLSYLIAALMTTISLGGYFIGIVRNNKWAYILTGLVALSYAVIYVLLQMETFAFLAGTLILFLILCSVMYLTRNLTIDDPLSGVAAKPEEGESSKR